MVVKTKFVVARITPEEASLLYQIRKFDSGDFEVKKRAGKIYSFCWVGRSTIIPMSDSEVNKIFG